MENSFIHSDSEISIDNSPAMRFNNLCLQIGNLEQGTETNIDEKRKIHSLLVKMVTEFKPEDQNKALQAAHQALEKALSSKEVSDEKYSV